MFIVAPSFETLLQFPPFRIYQCLDAAFIKGQPRYLSDLPRVRRKNRKSKKTLFLFGKGQFNISCPFLRWGRGKTSVSRGTFFLPSPPQKSIIFSAVSLDVFPRRSRFFFLFSGFSSGEQMTLGPRKPCGFCTLRDFSCLPSQCMSYDQRRWERKQRAGGSRNQSTNWSDLYRGQ